MDLEFTLNLDDLCDSVVHLLDGLELGESHSPLVGDVVDSSLGFSVLSAGSTHLHTHTHPMSINWPYTAVSFWFDVDSALSESFTIII